MSYCSSGVSAGCLFLLPTQITPTPFYHPGWLTYRNLTSSKCAPDHWCTQNVPYLPVLIRSQWSVRPVKKWDCAKSGPRAAQTVFCTSWDGCLSWFQVLLQWWFTWLDFSSFRGGPLHCTCRTSIFYSLHTDKEPKVRAFACRTG